MKSSENLKTWKNDGHFRIPHPQISLLEVSEHLQHFFINFIGFSSYFLFVTFYLRFYVKKMSFFKKLSEIKKINKDIGHLFCFKGLFFKRFFFM